MRARPSRLVTRPSHRTARRARINRTHVARFDFLRSLGTLVGLVVLAACLSGGATQPELSGSGTPILFVGNSLTYVNDIPGIVQALALARGDSLAVESVALPDSRSSTIGTMVAAAARRAARSRQ